LISSFSVIPFTNSQTNGQTDTGENITSLAEEKLTFEVKSKKR